MVVDRCRSKRLLSAAAASFVAIVGIVGAFGCTDSTSTSPDESTAIVSTTTPVTTSAAAAAAAVSAVSTAAGAAVPPASAALPTAGSSAAPVSESTVAIDPVALLQNAMDAAAPGYHYHSIVTVGGSTVVEVDGDRIGDGTRVGVVRDGVSVQYVITRDGTWVQPDGGEWDQMDTPPATADPITALRSPSAATVDAVDGTAVHLSVSVPAASLGLTGDATVVLAVVVDSGNLTAVVYTTSIDGQPATVETSVGPVIDGTPVVAPI